MTIAMPSSAYFSCHLTVYSCCQKSADCYTCHLHAMRALQPYFVNKSLREASQANPLQLVEHSVYIYRFLWESGIRMSDLVHLVDRMQWSWVGMVSWPTQWLVS